MYVRVLCFLFLFSLALSEEMQLPCQYIRQLVDGHNSRRMLLAKGEVGHQPPASEMKFMVWDEELEAKASAYANKKLQTGHNPDKSIPSGRFSVGENIYWLGTTNFTKQLQLEDAMSAWWDEHKDFTFKPISMRDFQSSKQIGHYTQMAWSNTIYLGCGAAKYLEGNWINYILVCNYGPPGNYMGQRPYRSGTPSNKLMCTVGEDCSHPYGPRCPADNNNQYT